MVNKFDLKRKMGYKSNLCRIYLICTSVFECTDVVIKGLQLLKRKMWGRIGNRKTKALDK